MSWQPTDWNQPRPDQKELSEALKKLKINEVTIDNPVIIEYADLLKSRIHEGGVIVKCYHVQSNEVVDWFAQRNRFDEMNFFKYFFSHPDVVKSLPAEFAKTYIRTDTFRWAIEWAFELDGNLASLVIVGGAYHFECNPRAVKELADKVCYAIFQYRYSDILVFQANPPLSWPWENDWTAERGMWSSWFNSIAWDHTIIIIDKKTMNIWVLLMTDND